MVADFIKTQFFFIIKQGAYTVIDKCWITGVLSVFCDIFGPLDATSIISNMPAYNGLCGFTESELRTIVQSYPPLSNRPLELDRVLRLIKRW